MLSGVEVNSLSLLVTIAVFLAESAAWAIGEVPEKCSHDDEHRGCVEMEAA